MTRSSIVRFRLLVALAVLSSSSALAQGVHVKAPRYSPGGEWTVVELDEPSLLPVLESGWQRSTFWDLRPVAGSGREIHWSVDHPHRAGLASVAETAGADLALCAVNANDGQQIGCRLIISDRVGPSGPRALWSSLPGETAKLQRVSVQLDPTAMLFAGASYTDRRHEDDDVAETIEGVALAEGIALTPAGPAEVVLLRETIAAKDSTRTVYRFVSENGRTVAEFETDFGVPLRGSVLTKSDRFADDGLKIDYETLSASLTPGSIGFLQYSMSFTGANCLADVDCGLSNAICVGADPVAVPPEPGSCRGPLSDLRAGWTGIADAIGIDQTSVSYQPDPDDPSTMQTLPEVWEFATLNKANMRQRTFNTIRDDTAWSGNLERCAAKDQTATPTDGSWQAYLKIDSYDELGAFVTRDVFTFNDNDTGTNPSIDVPFVVQDQANASDRTEICFQDSPGGNPADRLLNFFQFTGPDPASAVLGVGDIWPSGNWTSCSNPNGLHLTLASQCGDNFYPDCDGISPRGQGQLPNFAGLRGSITEDGYIHVAAGNYVPALLLLQETDIIAGADLIFSCLGSTGLRGIDWFWVHERYGLLALISGPNDDGTLGCSPLPPADWSCADFDNRTDGADFTWGPFPPYQISAQACLNGTKIDWALPADGSNLTGEPNLSNWGYVVSWGTENDPDLLADWTANPNHTPLPGQPGYLAAPPGSEPTSHVITGFGGGAINATVTTALSYTDPDAADTLPYRSAAFFRVVEDPARLDPGVFQIGNSVAPFVAKIGTDLDLSWPAIGGANGYSIEVFDLVTDLTVPCPAGLDCAPSATSSVFSGGAASAVHYGFRVYAIDGCGDASSN